MYSSSTINNHSFTDPLVSAVKVFRTVKFLGTAGPDSATFSNRYDNMRKYHPNDAFGLGENDQFLKAVYGEGNSFTIWFKFEMPKKITKVGIESGHNPGYFPHKIDILGSNGCGNWENLFHVENANFKEKFQLKSWDVPFGKRKFFLCIGIRFYKPPTKSFIMLKTVEMWEEKILPNL